MSDKDMSPAPEGFAALDGDEFAVLTTYRRDGAPAPTTVWIVQEGDKLYIQTGVNAGKVKRIRGNALVTLAPGTRAGEVLGDVVAAPARILPPGETAVSEEALQRKVWGAAASGDGAAREYGAGLYRSLADRVGDDGRTLGE